MKLSGSFINKGVSNIKGQGQKFSPYCTSTTMDSSSSVESQLRDLCQSLPLPLSEGKHKGQAGRIGIIGGSLEYTGAPYFSGVTALKCGADLVYVFCMKDAATPIKSYCPELIVFPFLDAEHGRGLTISRLLNLHSLVIGPGLGENVAVHSLIVSIVNYIKESKPLLSKMSLIFDADGIGLVADNKEVLRTYTGNVYLTPNQNEIKKLSLSYLGRRDIDVDDETVLKELVRNIGPKVTLLIKGPKDKIVTSEAVFNCSVSGSLRRVGGQGDLLSGSLGLFAYWASMYNNESIPSYPAEALACYAACSFTRTCSRLAFEKKQRSMITSDLIAETGDAYKHVFNTN